MIDRTEISRAIAKAIAYKQCGQQRKAEQWAARVVYLLDTMDILDQARLSEYAKASDWAA